MKKITTTKVGKDFAESNWILLDETPETTIIFKPEIHPGGVRGILVRYKKERGVDWKDLKDADFQKISLSPNTKFEIALNTETLNKLKQTIEEHTKIIQLGIKEGQKEYVVAESDKVIVVDDTTKRAIFDSLLKKKYSYEFWKLLQESEPELATHLSVGHLYAEKNKTINELTLRLKGKYSETTGP
jgi:hypothetical protein